MDDEVLIAYDDPIPKGALFYGNCQEERRAVRKDLTAGRKYRIQVRTWHQYFLTGFPLGMPSAFRFGAATATPPDELIRQAVEVAKKSDVAIAMVGLHEDYEQEGYDRLSMRFVHARLVIQSAGLIYFSLPGTNDQLVSALLAANPNTIVINTSGTPVEMPWADQASTVIQVKDCPAVLERN
jgi:beta-glucosidase